MRLLTIILHLLLVLTVSVWQVLIWSHIFYR